MATLDPHDDYDRVHESKVSPTRASRVRRPGTPKGSSMSTHR
jgi:hypothetical protein